MISGSARKQPGNKSERRKGGYAVFLACLIVLALVTFDVAIPETTRMDSGCCAPGSGPLAKDFSAYYVASWRLLHDPANIYTRGAVLDGGPQIAPQPQQYKYLPSFLVMVAPVLVLPYRSALLAFDALQFLLLPLIGLLTYRITKGRSMLASSLVAVAVLLQPSPLPGWGLSATYFWQWGEGQAKVLVTFFLVLALYLAKYGRPGLAGVACALSSFDPRFLVLATPLLLAYSRGSWTRLAAPFAVATALLDLPLLLPGVASGLAQTLVSGSALTPPYYYSWIPIFAVASITAVEWREVKACFGSRSPGSNFPL